MLVAFEGYDGFLNKIKSTGANWPLTFLPILERLALPSKEAAPKVEHFWLMAIDWICENLPRSLDSTQTLELGLWTSTNIIFSLEVPATIMGNLKSLVKTLFSALKVMAGLGLPGCQMFTWLS